MKKETPTVETDEYGAITYRNADGDKFYYINGKLHNPDGPAIVWADGDKEHYINGERHNPHGPAFSDADGHKEHWINGQLHNPHGPAVIRANGRKSYYINGKRLTEAQFKAWQAKQAAPLHNKTATIDGIEYTLIAK